MGVVKDHKKQQKVINEINDNENVASLEITQSIAGFVIAFLLALLTDIDIVMLGWIVVVLVIVVIGLSFVNPLFLRFIFIIIGFSLGVAVYYVLIYVFDFIPSIA